MPASQKSYCRRDANDGARAVVIRDDGRYEGIGRASDAKKRRLVGILPAGVLR
jgi:hypothetical protein